MSKTPKAKATQDPLWLELAELEGIDHNQVDALALRKVWEHEPRQQTGDTLPPALVEHLEQMRELFRLSKRDFKTVSMVGRSYLRAREEGRR